jgi:hypothetical protein
MRLIQDNKVPLGENEVRSFLTDVTELEREKRGANE